MRVTFEYAYGRASDESDRLLRVEAELAEPSEEDAGGWRVTSATILVGALPGRVLSRAELGRCYGWFTLGDLDAEAERQGVWKWEAARDDAADKRRDAEKSGDR